MAFHLTFATRFTVQYCNTQHVLHRPVPAQRSHETPTIPTLDIIIPIGTALLPCSMSAFLLTPSHHIPENMLYDSMPQKHANMKQAKG